MKTWMLLVVFLGLTTVVTDSADDFDNIECQSLWCTPTTLYRYKMNGKEVCCSDILHVYMVVKTVEEKNKKVKKCYCKPDPWGNVDSVL
ncbi:hypothetical protein RRG08_044571 [Elysia crispata]|uniref:Uncharacterized protein n=1 Tax=Elysia crispata TaxID=231223 RepID=A0AAE0ZTU3_9GAST|nr:hypothetical protein RRG08_044571 [Elysia crispata]